MSESTTENREAEYVFKIYSWNPKVNKDGTERELSSMQDIEKLVANLSVMSPRHLPWRISINTKDKKLTRARRIFQQDNDGIEEYTFVKMNDIDQCVVIPIPPQSQQSQQSQQPQQSQQARQQPSGSKTNVLSENLKPRNDVSTIEEKLTISEDLKDRISFNAYGEKFLIGESIVSVGILERSGIPHRCVIEIGSKVDGNARLAMTGMDVLSAQLVPKDVKLTVLSEHGEWNSVISRGLLWRSCTQSN